MIDSGSSQIPPTGRLADPQWTDVTSLTWENVVGVTGFEPAASSSRTKRATKLRHTPMVRGRV
jgi:hypothetical protein